MKQKGSLFKKFLGLSNGLVLILVAHTFINNSSQKMNLFSTSESELKLEQSCKKGIQQVLENKRKGYTCHIKKSQRAVGTSYATEMKVIVKANQAGVSIKATGSLVDGTRYATEEGFCETCEHTTFVQNKNFQEVLSAISALQMKIENEITQFISSKKRAYNQKHTKENIGNVKENLCLGKWNDLLQDFIDFDADERLNCQFIQLLSQNILAMENYYQEEMKTEIWEGILYSDDNLIILKNIENILSNPQFYPLSIRASAHIIYNYIGWKNIREEDPALAAKLVGQIRSEAKNTNGVFVEQEYLKMDLKYLELGLLKLKN